MILMTVCSILQMISLIYAGIITLRITRMQTLSKNFEWVIHNRTFAEKFKKPHLLLYFLLVSLSFGVLIVGWYKQSMEILLYWKYYSILVIMVCIICVYYLIEINVMKQIPERPMRTASLKKRSLKDYLNPGMIVILKTGIGIVIVSNIFSYFIHKISLAPFVSNMLTAVALFVILYSGIIRTLKERIPHQKDLAVITKYNIDHNYRKSAITIMVTVGLIFIVFHVIELILQWYGLDIVYTPEKQKIFEYFGEPYKYKHLFSIYEMDVVTSIITVPLMLFISLTKSNREILSIKVVQ